MNKQIKELPIHPAIKAALKKVFVDLAAMTPNELAADLARFENDELVLAIQGIKK